MKIFQIIAVALLVVIITIQSHSQSSLNIDLLFHWEDTSLVGSSAFNNTYNEVWGFVENGVEYAVIGTTAGTHIFDVSDPVNAYEATFIPGKVQGAQVIHRDYHDLNGFLYIVCDEGASSLRVADLSFLPDSAPLVYDSDTSFSRSHNIFIDEVKSRLYACVGGKLKVYDISSSENPVSIGELNFNQGVHDLYVRNDTAYINVGTDGLFIYDFSDVSNPAAIGTLNSYPYQGYNHSGWLSEDGNTYVMADETWGAHVKLIDVSDLSNISIPSTVFSNVDTSQSIVHNVIIRGDYLFVSHYYDGLYVYNISDINNPTLTGYYDTSTLPHIGSYEGAWGVYPLLPSGVIVVSDMQTGLYLLDVDNITSVSENNEKVSNNMLIWPNPFNGVINIQNGSSFDEISLFDVSGKKILKQNGVDQISIETNLKPGVYVLQGTKNEQKIRKLLIK